MEGCNTQVNLVCRRGVKSFDFSFSEIGIEQISPSNESEDLGGYSGLFFLEEGKCSDLSQAEPSQEKFGH